MKKFLVLFICLLLMLTSCKARPAGDHEDEEILMPMAENSVADDGVKLDSDDKYISDEQKDSETVTLYKNDVKSGISNGYEITGDDARELMSLFGGEMEDAPCDCMPTHSVTFGDKTYDVVIGDIFCSHFVTENQKHIFTIDEYKKLTALFEKCVVDSNFVDAKDMADGLQRAWSGEIKVTAYTEEHIIEGGVWKGVNSDKKEFTITGKDAYTIYESISLKAFAEDQLKCTVDATLEIDGQKYGLIMYGDRPSIFNNVCTRCSLDKDDDIIKIMEKYIKKSEIPDGTIIETGNSTYEYRDGEYILQ